MISCISCENVHLFGPAFHSQFQLRYRAFIERQDYDVRIYRGMEYDQYDTPASHYLVYTRRTGEPWASAGSPQRFRAACCRTSGPAWWTTKSF